MDGATWMHVGDVWLAADTRISTQSISGTRVNSTDAAVEILPITLEFFQERSDGGPGTAPSYRNGMAKGKMWPSDCDLMVAAFRAQPKS